VNLFSSFLSVYCTYFKAVVFVFQSLPRINLNNYSALPLDEGDEDREAGIGYEEDEGSDLETGGDPSSAGELPLHMNHIFRSSWMCFR